MLAVALGATLYLWDGETHTVTELMTLPSSAAYISSVGWLDDGVHLAVGARHTACNAPGVHCATHAPPRQRTACKIRREAARSFAHCAWRALGAGTLRVSVGASAKPRQNRMKSPFAPLPVAFTVAKLRGCGPAHASLRVHRGAGLSGTSQAELLLFDVVKAKQVLRRR